MVARLLFRQMMKSALGYQKMSFCKKSLLITSDEFEKYRASFTSMNSRYKKKGLRTRERFVHLHANSIGKYVEVHVDHGNPAHGIFFGLLHLVCDVLPYVMFCLVRHAKLSIPAIEVHKNAKL